MSMRNNAKIRLIAAAVLPFLLLAAQVFGQSANSSLSGTVLDASQAVLPGATVTATNQETGVTATTLTNDAGNYTFPSLQPGLYKVTVEMPSFQTQTKTDVKLGVAGQARLNFELAIAGSETQIEVTTTAQDMLIETSSSTGTVLQPQAVTQLPLVSNDVMDLINIMGGVVKADNPIFSNLEQSFAGVNSANINLQADGITISEVRYNSGIVANTRMNPEMVGEFKMILSPVDAELGRGMGQVQILTKSGSNAYHGSGVWNIQNTALDANEFQNNKTGVQPNWRNLNNYTLTASGPIVKNKTFFFVSWDQAISRSRSSVNTSVLTNCARKGIYRYFSGWNNGNYLARLNPEGSTPTAPVVGANGVPLDPRFAGDVVLGRNSLITTDPDGAPSSLQYASVFGPLSDAAKANIERDLINCSFYEPYPDPGVTSYYDTYRRPDTDYIPRFSKMMPEVNNWDTGDGLNTAGHRWVRGIHGSDTVFGSGEDNQRRNITAKVDHNFNDRHRFSGTYTFESNDGEDAYKSWPNGYGGAVIRKPQRFTTSFTSTLRPTLLNEFRFGLSRTATHTNEPLNNPKTGEQMKELLQQLLPTNNFPNYAGFPLIVSPGSGSAAFAVEGTPSNPYGSRGNLPATWGGHDHRWTVADTVTWTKGNHSLKFGGELRLVKSYQDTNGTAGFYGDANTFPSAVGGVTQYSTPRGINPGTVPGLVGMSFFLGALDLSSGTVAGMQNLLNYMSGSLGSVRQYYYVNSPTALTWNDASKGELTQVFDMRQREFSFFAKDDWKVNSSLTLNLGIRYEYYGLPWLDSGMTTGLAAGSTSIFGVTGRGFDSWWPANPTNLGTDYMTRQVFIGPNSPNPSQLLFNKDLNNFGPAVGFAWQLPWFGKGKTTLRGGYQMSYTAIANADPTMGFGGVMAKVIGTSYNHQFAGDSTNWPYMSIADLPNLVPTSQYLPPEVKPLAPVAITARNQSLSVYDPNIRNPYIQSLTLSLSRSITSNLNVDVRYVGTLSRKSIGTINLNAANFRNNGLFDALEAARRGENPEMFDRMLAGIQFQHPDTFMATPAVGTGGFTGGDAIRLLYRTNLANGDFVSIANALSTLNYSKSFMNFGLPDIPSNVRGTVLRLNGFPENFIYTNPQFGTANWIANLNHGNYHSLQAKVELRPTRGVSFTSTYTWSRNLGLSGSYTDPGNRAADYTLLGSHRSHQLNTYGTFDLPFGPNGFFLRNSSGALRRIVEGWQMTWILSLASGKPNSLSSSTNHLYANGVPDFVGPEEYKEILTKGGKVFWAPGADDGNYWWDEANNRPMFTKVPDPQCSDRSLLSADLEFNSITGARICTMQALATVVDYDPETKTATPGEIILQQPLPGKQGNFGRMNLNGIGMFSLDATLGKTIALTEGKSLQLRVDATNILNHPTPSNSTFAWNARFTQIYDPNMSLGSGTFGVISSKGQHRTWQAKIRFQF